MVEVCLVLDGFWSVLWVLPLRDPCLCCCGCLLGCPDFAFPFHLSASDIISDPSRCLTHLIISRPYDEEKSGALVIGDFNVIFDVVFDVIFW